MDCGSGNGKFFGFGESEVRAMDEMKGDGPMKRSSSGQEAKGLTLWRAF
jgi:predicted ThiF/HesA family dinucleotide-utilizing enzyme